MLNNKTAAFGAIGTFAAVAGINAVLAPTPAEAQLTVDGIVFSSNGNYICLCATSNLNCYGCLYAS